MTLCALFFYDPVEDEAGFTNYQCHKTSENDNAVNKYGNSVNRDGETSGPLSWVTSGSNEEDAGSEPTTYAPLSLDGFEYDFSRRTFVPTEHSYSALMDSSPRKPVLLGPNHQATIPPWTGPVKKNIVNFSSSPATNTVDGSDYEEKLMGTCVIPMPDSDLSEHNNDKAAERIFDCGCHDEGSVRCVQQHVMEARERVLKSLRYEKFVKLGLYDMGEEVSRRWTHEEELVFHEVVYSNPVSLGRKFWKHLSAVFPYRTKKEIVSYYFNVFVLRRRATQNRSHLLDIDSDDDEWHGSYGGFYGVRVPEEDNHDSAIESPVYYDDREENSSDDDDNDDDGGDCGDGDLQGGTGEAVRKDCGGDFKTELHNAKSFYETGFCSMDSYLDNPTYDGVSNFNDWNVQDDSCTSFEFQPDVSDNINLVDDGVPALKENRAETDINKCLPDKFDERSNHLISDAYLVDSCDAKAWDARFLSPVKGVDLLPTSNIIEEIFGQGSWDTMSRNA